MNIGILNWHNSKFRYHVIDVFDFISVPYTIIDLHPPSTL